MHKMNYLLVVIAGIITFIQFILFFYFLNIIFLITGVISLLVSVFLYVFMTILYYAAKDKEIDIVEAVKSGLIVVKCENCDKTNVLEDKYCVLCGERLDNNA